MLHSYINSKKKKKAKIRQGEINGWCDLGEQLLQRWDCGPALPAVMSHGQRGVTQQKGPWGILGDVVPAISSAISSATINTAATKGRQPDQ